MLNVALPYQDLSLMDACIKAGIDYVDTANYEHPDLAKLSIKNNGQEMINLKKQEF